MRTIASLAVVAALTFTSAGALAAQGGPPGGMRGRGPGGPAMMDRALLKGITLSDAQQASLKSGQLQWLKQRDQQCSEEKESGYFVNLDCAVNMTQERLAFLQERERECNSTGCANDKLGQ